jgi:Domain of unknown function (DUF4340)
MSPRHLKLIALALAVLLLLWGGAELFSRDSDRVTGGLVLPPLKPADADTIAIVKGRDSIVLTKQADTAWRVNGHAATPGGVPDLFRALADSVHPELVAQDSGSYGRLAVDSAAGRWLTIRGAGKPRLRLIVGAQGSEFRSVYLRRPGDAHVYLWRGQLAQLVARGADDWRDKRIAVLQPDSITALAVERGTDRYRLTRSAARWLLPSGATDSAAVARYLERLRTITADGFATPAAVDSTRGRAARRRLTVHAGGRLLLALAFDSTAGGFLVRHVAGVGGEAATVYRMTVWDVDGLTPTSRSLAHQKP